WGDEEIDDEALGEDDDEALDGEDDEPPAVPARDPEVFTDAVRRRLHEAIGAVTDEASWQELVSLSFDGKEWILTGGMSWGDGPTEIFNYVCLLGDSEICVAPVVRAEEEGGVPGGVA
ncbi:MAG: hypothetical protein ACYCTE_17175, partial [Acidimicrobiales bacterium]